MGGSESSLGTACGCMPGPTEEAASGGCRGEVQGGDRTLSILDGRADSSSGQRQSKRKGSGAQARRGSRGRRTLSTVAPSAPYVAAAHTASAGSSSLQSETDSEGLRVELALARERIEQLTQRASQAEAARERAHKQRRALQRRLATAEGGAVRRQSAAADPEAGAAAGAECASGPPGDGETASPPAQRTRSTVTEVSGFNCSAVLERDAALEAAERELEQSLRAQALERAGSGSRPRHSEGSAPCSARGAGEPSGLPVVPDKQSAAEAAAAIDRQLQELQQANDRLWQQQRRRTSAAPAPASGPKQRAGLTAELLRTLDAEQGSLVNGGCVPQPA
eukprot:TRINITY_DN24005_c0_g1_i1.p1 TRINITY_DN24005_c0_g1~~TRINITY_DN24005_c0_g1_i1.p1  ORF type:complete len:364 (+),score=122.33 TRINITY_DN24005_c0_g1_i1:85-1092(+)